MEHLLMKYMFFIYYKKLLVYGCFLLNRGALSSTNSYKPIRYLLFVITCSAGILSVSATQCNSSVHILRKHIIAPAQHSRFQYLQRW